MKSTTEKNRPLRKKKLCELMLVLTFRSEDVEGTGQSESVSLMAWSVSVTYSKERNKCYLIDSSFCECLTFLLADFLPFPFSEEALALLFAAILPT